MNSIKCAVLLLLSLTGCIKSNKPLVVKNYADSLISHYSNSGAININHAEMAFWRTRIDPKVAGISNELKYASTLVRQFHLSGDIRDLNHAEKILKETSQVYNDKEAGVYVALTEIALLKHQFKNAAGLLNKAKQIGVQSYVANSFSFDVEFELGHYNLASFYLSKIKSPVDFGYHFRKAKLSHLNGQADTAVSEMLKAAELAPGGSYLQGVALANAADFYIHTGELAKATGLFKQSISINKNDFHSISGLGTIAMKNDRNYELAGSLFKLVKSNYALPDPLFKFYQLAQSREDKRQEIWYAKQFTAAASRQVYGKMYSKYLIEIYSGVLKKPELAEKIARAELTNRLTPQTAAWYAWALFANRKPQQAEKIYKKYVSGKPLEGFELYYMGNMMAGLKKAYTAEEFYKAADQNKFDLSPAMIKHLESR
jgi:hypothetical protein